MLKPEYCLLFHEGTFNVGSFEGVTFDLTCAHIDSVRLYMFPGSRIQFLTFVVASSF
jgi:hypothetical protein